MIIIDDKQFGQWLAGFWEGDGSVFCSAGYPKVAFCQKERDEIS